ncbi:50S ribosomal protein L7/L12 [Candidatus Falkowbacteria bacterium]|nr:50S ribosomal protein L7/L12 [Candidatus Falkowbacteria bacterium]
MSEDNKQPQDEQKPAEESKDSAEETKQVDVPAKFKSLVEEIEKMSVLDLAELVKILEDKFGVSAAAPMAVAAAAPGADAGEAAEEKSSFNVELISAGENKISVIKALREVTELGLKDAKDLADAAPKVIKEDVAKEEAETMKKKIEEAGGKVELK